MCPGSGDNGLPFGLITGLAVGPKGELYVSDRGNSRILRVVDNIATTIAGGTMPKQRGGFVGGPKDPNVGYVDGPALAVAKFKHPEQLALAPGEKIYIAESYHGRIRMLFDGVVSTVVGSSENSYVNGPIEISRLNSTTGVAADPQGVVYIADHYNHCIRKLDNNVVSTLAGPEPQIPGGPTASLERQNGFADGPATEARFHDPEHIAIGADGSVFVSDGGNNRIRRIKDGVVSTFAGTGAQQRKDGNALTEAAFFHPKGIAIDPRDGAMYVADQYNNAVRQIKDGIVTTIYGREFEGMDHQQHTHAVAVDPIASVLYIALEVYIVAIDLPVPQPP